MNLRLTKIPPNVDLLVWFQLLATNHDDRTLVYYTPQPADFLPAQWFPEIQSLYFCTKRELRIKNIHLFILPIGILSAKAVVPEYSFLSDLELRMSFYAKHFDAFYLKFHPNIAGLLFLLPCGATRVRRRHFVPRCTIRANCTSSLTH